MVEQRAWQKIDLPFLTLFVGVWSWARYKYIEHWIYYCWTTQSNWLSSHWMAEEISLAIPGIGDSLLRLCSRVWPHISFHSTEKFRRKPSISPPGRQQHPSNTQRIVATTSSSAPLRFEIQQHHGHSRRLILWLRRLHHILEFAKKWVSPIPLPHSNAEIRVKLFTFSSLCLCETLALKCCQHSRSRI